MLLKFFIAKFTIDSECMYLLLNAYTLLHFGSKSVVKEKYIILSHLNK